MPVPDRGLRRLVAKLARELPEDIEAVLAAMPPPQRRRLRSLLAEHAGVAPPSKPQGADGAREAVAIEVEGLSPWLAARVRAASAGSGGGRCRGTSFSIAPAAREALRAEGAALAPERPPVQPRRPLLKRFRRPARRAAA
jgi:hypothetical protein